MKKFLLIICSFLLIFSLLTACSAGAAEDDPVSQETGKIAGDSVDIDFTTLSPIMVSSEVYNVINNPKDYIGKTMKLAGLYSPNTSEETGQTYHFISIEDAAGCCQQGIEFIWNGDHSYPEDQTRVEVIGTYDSYEELGETFYYISVDELTLV